MNGTELREWLDRLEDVPAPEPSAIFVAKLEADLRAMGQVDEAEARHRSSTRRARLFVVAAPVAALTAAAAAAAVTLLPGDPHPKRVTTADPGVTAPAAPPVSEPAQPGPTTPTPTTVAPTPLAAPAPTATTTTAARKTTPTAPTPGPADHTVTTPAPHPGDPVSPTVPPATTTTTPAPETLSLNCGGGMPSGSPAVSCAWSQSSSPSFAWYHLWREVAGSPHVLVFSSDNRPTTSYGDRSVQAGTTYSYKLEVTDSAGNVIGRSNIVTVSCC